MTNPQFLTVKLININEINSLVNHKKHIYRFLPIERMIETLEKSKLTFINPSKWSDPFDKFLFNKTLNSGNFLNSVFCLCLKEQLFRQHGWTRRGGQWGANSWNRRAGYSSVRR